MSNDNNVQFTLEERTQLLNKLGKFDDFFSILFPGKNFSNELDVNDIISIILNNPIFYTQKKVLEDQAEIFLDVGEITKAIK